MSFTPCKIAKRLFSMGSLMNLAVTAGCLLSLPQCARTQQTYWTTPLGITTQGYMSGLNDKGQVTGNGPSHVTLWMPSAEYGLPAGLTDLGTLPGGTNSYAHSINSLGQVVGEATLNGNPHAFVWYPPPAVGLHDLGTLGGTNSTAHSINASGQIAGYAFTGDGLTHAFLWLPSAAYGLPAFMNDLGTLGGTYSTANGVNVLGQAAGTSSNASGNLHAFLWLPSAAYGMPAGMHDLGTLGGTYSYANGVNTLGQVAGAAYLASGQKHAFLWLPSAAYGLPAGMNDLSAATGETDSEAYGINDKGQVAGFGSANGFVWQNGNRTPLNGQPAAINNAGQIIINRNLLTPVASLQPNHGGNTIGSRAAVTLLYGSPNTVTGVALLAPGPAHMPGTNSDDVLARSLTTIDSFSLRATFNLGGHTPGPRSVMLTLNGGSTAILPLPFTIDNAGTPQVKVSLVGGLTANINGVSQQCLRVGRTGTYQFVLSNTSNTDAVGVPLWIVFPNLPPDVTFDYSGFGVQSPPAIAGMNVDWNNYPMLAQSGSQFMLPMFLPRLPAGSTRTLQIKLKLPPNSPDASPIPIQVWSNPLYHQVFPAGAAPQVQSCLKAMAEKAYANAGTSQGADDSAFNAAAAQVVTQINSLVSYSNANSGETLTSFSQMLTEILLLTPQGRVLSVPTVQNAVALTLAQSPSLDCFGQESFQSVAPLPVASLDPNSLSGPLSYTDAGGNTYVRDDTPMVYTISFGNATGPNVIAARKVVLQDDLDSGSLDVTGLSTQIINVEGTTGTVTASVYVLQTAGATQRSSPLAGLYTMQNILPDDFAVMQAGGGMPVSVQLSASVSLDTGTLLYSFQTSNPAGFLAAGAGGSVSFSVPWKAGLPAGTVLQNKAAITFDANAPLFAPDTSKGEPPLIYILDNAAPVSHVTALPATEPGPQFTVQWMGADNANGSGIMDYTISVSDNGSAFTPWLTSTTLTQMKFTGVYNHAYAFLCQARDNVGNAEAVHSTADTTTTIAAAVTGMVKTGLRLVGVSNLSAISSASPLGTFHIEFRLPNTTNAVYSADVTLTPVPLGSPFGTATLSGVPVGNYDVTVKGSKNLRVSVLNFTVTSGTATLPDLALRAGDANNDNAVDLLDFGVMVNAFGSSASVSGSGYDARADFSFDGRVDLLDFGLLVNEFGNFGAP